MQGGGLGGGRVEAVEGGRGVGEERVELGKAKASRRGWGTPGAAEKAAAKDRVEAARTGSH